VHDGVAEDRWESLPVRIIRIETKLSVNDLTYNLYILFFNRKRMIIKSFIFFKKIENQKIVSDYFRQRTSKKLKRERSVQVGKLKHDLQLSTFRLI
jgi:hypothetical protein